MKLLILKFSWLTTPSPLIDRQGYNVKIPVTARNAQYAIALAHQNLDRTNPGYARVKYQLLDILAGRIESREENSENLKIVKFLHFLFTLHGRLKLKLSPY